MKCCQAIENSIAVDCFDVRNIEDIFKITLTEESLISTNYEVEDNKKLGSTEPHKPHPVSDPSLYDRTGNRNDTRTISKTEAKDFLGPLRNCRESLSILKI